MIDPATTPPSWDWTITFDGYEGTVWDASRTPHFIGSHAECKDYLEARRLGFNHWDARDLAR